MQEVIQSPNNATYKYLKSLTQTKYRSLHQAYLIEGFRIVQEALKHPKQLQTIILRASSSENVDAQLADLISKDNLHPTILLNERLFSEISDTSNPQGVAAVMSYPVHSIDFSSPKKQLILLLDALQDPGNLGTLIRTADSVKATAIILSKGCVDVYNPKVIRSTMGSIFRVPILKCAHVTTDILKLRNAGFKIFASTASTQKTLFETQFPTKSVLMIGNEANGISEELLQLSDTSIKIPMLGSIESLNASVAGSVIMYEIYRQWYYA